MKKYVTLVLIMSLQDNTVPQVLYNTRDPLSQPSELYTIDAVKLYAVSDPHKCWVVKEEHGYWDESKKEFLLKAQTLKPTDPKHAVSIEQAFKDVNAQVMVRVKAGFKFQFEWYPYAPPFYHRYEIQPDGTKRQY